MKVIVFSGQQVLGPNRGNDSDSEAPLPSFNTRLGSSRSGEAAVSFTENKPSNIAGHSTY